METGLLVLTVGWLISSWSNDQKLSENKLIMNQRQLEARLMLRLLAWVRFRLTLKWCKGQKCP